MRASPEEVPRLVLLNGAPGSGKSTLAGELARGVPMMLALDVDALKQALGGWEQDRTVAGLQARRLALAVAGEHLASGHDVVLGQYLARTTFLEDLERLARRSGATFHEFVLEVDEATLADRLAARHARPDRPEHHANNALVGPSDAAALVGSLEPLRLSRPGATWIDASGSLPTTLARLEGFLTLREGDAPPRC